MSPTLPSIGPRTRRRALELERTEGGSAANSGIGAAPCKSEEVRRRKSPQFNPSDKPITTTAAPLVVNPPSGEARREPPASSLATATATATTRNPEPVNVPPPRKPRRKLHMRPKPMGCDSTGRRRSVRLNTVDTLAVPETVSVPARLGPSLESGSSLTGYFSKSIIAQKYRGRSPPVRGFCLPSRNKSNGATASPSLTNSPPSETHTTTTDETEADDAAAQARLARPGQSKMSLQRIHRLTPRADRRRVGTSAARARPPRTHLIT